MKLLTLIFAFLCSFNAVINLAGAPSQFQIAAWYLQADLVIICSVQHIDTIFYHHHDSIEDDTMRVQWDLVREKYAISVDSVLRYNDSLFKTIPEDIDTIYTPKIKANYKKECYPYNKFIGFNEEGDSIVSICLVYNRRVDDVRKRFVLNQETTKYLVFLNHTSVGYTIQYQQKYNSDFVNYLKRVEKGEGFFNMFHRNN